MGRSVVDIAELRRRRGLSIRAAAAEIGVPKSNLHRLEHGDFVHPLVAVKVADYYGIAVRDLWPDEDEAA